MSKTRKPLSSGSTTGSGEAEERNQWVETQDLRQQGRVPGDEQGRREQSSARVGFTRSRPGRPPRDSCDNQAAPCPQPGAACSGQRKGPMQGPWGPGVPGNGQNSGGERGRNRRPGMRCVDLKGRTVVRVGRGRRATVGTWGWKATGGLWAEEWHNPTLSSWTALAPGPRLQGRGGGRRSSACHLRGGRAGTRLWAAVLSAGLFSPTGASVAIFLRSESNLSVVLRPSP